MSATKQVSKDAIIYGLGNGLTKVLGLILLPFYTSVLTPADYGVLATVTTFITLIVSSVNIGLDGASMYYFYTINDEKARGELLFTKFVLRLISVVPAVILSFFSKQISFLLFNSENYTGLIFISCLLIPAQMLMGEQQQIYRLHHLPWKYNLMVVLRTVTNLGLGITLVLALGFGVWGAQLASFTAAATVFVFSFFYFTRKIYTYKFNFYWAKKMFAYGYPLIIGGLAIWVCRWSDRIFLLHYRDLTEIGLYSISDAFSSPLMIINAALQMSFLPIFWSLYNKDENKNKTTSRKAAAEIWSFFLCVSVVAAIFLSVFSVDLIRFISNKNFIMGALAVPFLCFALIAAQSQQLTRIGLFMEKKTKYMSVIALIAALVNIGLNFYFIPKYGFVGAAFTTLISYFLSFLISYIISNRIFAVEHKTIRNFIFYFIGLGIALFFPFLELVFSVHVSIFIKIISFFSVLFVPFLLGVIHIKDIGILKTIFVNRKGAEEIN